MTTVRVTSEISLDQLLDGMAQLETADLERLGAHISTLLAQRKAASLPQSETELLQQINQGLPDETQQRYHHLQAKLQAETITPAEHQELLTLIDTVEQADVDRLQHLLTLAQLRQVPPQRTHGPTGPSAARRPCLDANQTHIVLNMLLGLCVLFQIIFYFREIQ